MAPSKRGEAVVKKREPSPTPSFDLLPPILSVSPSPVPPAPAASPLAPVQPGIPAASPPAPVQPGIPSLGRRLCLCCAKHASLDVHVRCSFDLKNRSNCRRCREQSSLCVPVSVSLCSFSFLLFSFLSLSLPEFRFSDSGNRFLPPSPVSATDFSDTSVFWIPALVLNAVKPPL